MAPICSNVQSKLAGEELFELQLDISLSRKPEAHSTLRQSWSGPHNAQSAGIRVVGAWSHNQHVDDPPKLHVDWAFL